MLENGAHTDALRSFCADSVDEAGVTKFICHMYGQKMLNNVNEARYRAFMKMTDGGIT